MSGRGWRPIAFLLAMLGFGLRLDTAWQRTGWLLLAAAVAVVVGLGRPTGPGRFVGGNDPR
jgi:hypothetical protein